MNKAKEILDGFTPSNWISNELHNKDEKATKSDDAAIPTHFWNNTLAHALGYVQLSQLQADALEKIREFIVKRVWKPSVVRCFCSYLKCRKCHDRRINAMFANERFDKACKMCAKFEHNRLKNVGVERLDQTISWIGVSNKFKGKVLELKKYGWTEDGRKKYKKMYCILRKFGKPKLKLEVDKDIAAAKDCLETVNLATVWKWNGGSRLFFWRWGEFINEARDGAKTFIQGPLPNCKEKQSVSKDERIWSLVQNKLRDVRREGYIAAEKAEVKSVTSFFDVPKGPQDIRMVYNATSS